MIGTGISLKRVPISSCFPNPWQFNTMEPEVKIKLSNGLDKVQKEVGTNIPIICRPHPTKTGKYPIVDGEHRWKALKKKGRRKISILVGDFSESLSINLSSSLNYLRGEKDPERYVDALRRQIEEFEQTPEDLAQVLPESLEEIEHAIAQQISRSVEEEEEEQEKKDEDSLSEEPQETFVERTFVLSTSAAHVVDLAIAEIKRSIVGKNPDGRALELMAGDYLQGAGGSHVHVGRSSDRKSKAGRSSKGKGKVRGEKGRKRSAR